VTVRVIKVEKLQLTITCTFPIRKVNCLSIISAIGGEFFTCRKENAPDHAAPDLISSLMSKNIDLILLTLHLSRLVQK